jgi:adenylate cyclase
MKSWLHRIRWSAWLLAVLVAALGWVMHDTLYGYGIRNLSYDLLHILRRDNIPANEAIVVYLDEVSHEELGQKKNAPWDRTLHARMIDRLTEAGARTVVMDIVFSDPAAGGTAPEADTKLAEAMRRNGRVIAGADHITVNASEKRYDPPIELLQTNMVDYGSVEMRIDRDLIIRAHAPNEQVYSMSWATAKFLNAPVTKTTDPEQFAPSMDVKLVNAWIHYYGPPNSIPSVRYSEAIDPLRTSANLFSNKVVFIGAKVITKLQNERNDAYRNPFSFFMERKGQEPLIYGVEVQATMFLNLLRGDWLRRPSFYVETWAILLFGAIVGYGFMRMRPVVAIIVALLALFVVVVVCRQLFIYKLIWLPWLIPFLQILFALICAVSLNSIRLYVENRMFVQSLEMYLSPKLVKKFAADKDRKLLKPGANNEKLTILFSDIEKFTSITEGMDPDELCQVMNEYFQGAVGGCIHPTDGTVVKYIGDAIFAFWNAPDPQPDHAVRACEAALRFREQSKVPVRNRKLVTRIGLHTGVAKVGNFGSDTRVDYTALGENINLASRMEGLNKFLGTDVLITGDVKKEIGDRFITRYLGRFILKGFEKSVDVYELVALREGGSAPAWHREFEEGLRHFQQRDFGAATMSFERVLESASDETTSKFYLKHIKEVVADPPPDNWSGEVELKEK